MMLTAFKQFASLASLALALPAAAQEAEPPTPAAIVAQAAPEEWVAIAPQDLLVMQLAPAADGSARQVVIQLMPPPFSQPWVENIRTLAAAHWWDGTSVYRVVDNWVAQWGGGEGEQFVLPPLPPGVNSPVASYDTDLISVMLGAGQHNAAMIESARRQLLIQAFLAPPQSKLANLPQAAQIPI